MMTLVVLRLFLVAVTLCSMVMAFSIHAPLQKASISSRPHFFAASVPVFMSETAETAATSDNEVSASAEVESPSEPVELPAEPVAEIAPDVGGESSFEMTPEEAAAKRKIQRERYTLFVGNLPFDATETEIKSMFEPHGKVDLINIPRDRTTQKPRGFAFVDMSSAGELEAAIAAVDGTLVEGRELRVMKSVAKGDVVKSNAPRKERSEGPGGPPKGTKKIYMGNIPFSVSKEEIKDFYSEYGEVVDVYIPQNPDTGVGRGFAFVTMKEEDAATAIEKTNGADFGGRTLVVNEPLPPGKKAPSRKTNNTKLYVGNLSFYTVVETLEDIFGEFGPVVDCYLPEDPSTGGSRGFGFVTMAREDALNAIKEIDGCEVDGRVIRVNEAQPKGGRGPSNNNSMNDDEMGVISSSWDDMDNDQ